MALAWVIGIWLIARAIIEVYAAFAVDSGSDRWWRLLGAVFYGIVGLTGRVRIPGAAVLMPTVGGLLVGLLALGIPQILSSGYGWVQFATQTSSLMTVSYTHLTLPTISPV